MSSPLPNVEDLPKSLDYRNFGGRNYASVVRNQHIPNYCGACYIFAATSALADRIRLGRGDRPSQSVNLSPQAMLNCDAIGGDNGCHGGDPINGERVCEKRSDDTSFVAFSLIPI